MIVPERGKRSLTDALLCTLYRHEPSIGVVIVDDSPDGSGGRRWRTYGKGVTAAWNLGLQVTNSSFVLLLNNDVVVKGPFIERLVEAAGRDAVSGAATRREAENRETVLEGWCLCFHRDVVNRVGYFNERYKLYFQDTDWQMRVKGSGMTLRQINIPVEHIGHQTAHDPKAMDQADRREQWKRDRELFRSRWCR